MEAKNLPDCFQESLAGEKPPEEFSLPLQAIWWERKGDWNKAHEVAQEANSKDGDHVHAFLHRIEGDANNAAYWYARAGREVPSLSTDEERVELVRHFLG